MHPPSESSTTPRTSSKEYEDFIASIGTALCVSVISVSVGQLITAHYFFYLITILVVITTCATLYHHKLNISSPTFLQIKPRPVVGGRVGRALLGGMRAPRKRTSFHGFTTTVARSSHESSPERRRAWTDELQGDSLNTVSALRSHLSVPLSVSLLEATRQVQKKKCFSKQKCSKMKSMRLKTK